MENSERRPRSARGSGAARNGGRADAAERRTAGRARAGRRGRSGAGCLSGVLVLLAAVAVFTVLFIAAHRSVSPSGGEEGLGGIHPGFLTGLFGKTERENPAETGHKGSIDAKETGTNVPPKEGPPVICVDAGHGYDDSGAMHGNLNGLTEKDITLDIALRLADLLREAGYTVVMTRETEEGEWPPLDDRGLSVMTPHDRCDFANAAGADLFISVHCNSIDNSTAMNGTELYYTRDREEDDAGYAQALADSLEGEFGERPKVIGNPDGDSYIVNHWVDMPSVLVETGYITNKHDAQLMLTEEWRARMAEALAAGTEAFLNSANAGGAGE